MPGIPAAGPRVQAAVARRRFEDQTEWNARGPGDIRLRRDPSPNRCGVPPGGQLEKTCQWHPPQMVIATVTVILYMAPFGESLEHSGSVQ